MIVRGPGTGDVVFMRGPAAAKLRHGPQTLLHMNQNIEPAEDQVTDAATEHRVAP